MNNIKFTENVEEMIKIGKEIVESKPTTYTKRMCGIIMKTIDENMPKANDSEKQNVFYRSIYDYWVYGTNVAEEFYFDFLHKTHEQKLEYVTNKNRFLYINHLNDKNYSYLLNDKYEAYKLLKPYYKRDVIQIKSEADYEVFSDFVDKHPIFVAKPAALGLAIGVHKVNLADYPDKMTLMRELLVEGQEADKNYVWGGSSAVVLEELIEQHEALAAIHPQSVNGIRVTTVRIGDEVHLYHPWFKIGADGNFITSAAFGTMDAGIDHKTGIVDSLGCKENGEQHEYHPQTGIKIPGYAIPEWDSLVEMATELAKNMPESICYVGWDLVLTKDNGWCVMEGNYAGEFMWQMVYNKGMKKEFEELINWKPSVDFWWQSK